MSPWTSGSTFGARLSGTWTGWAVTAGGVEWFVSLPDGRRRSGVAMTRAGAKSAITQVKRRMAAS